MSAKPGFFSELHLLLTQERDALTSILDSPQTPEVWDWARVKLKINRLLEKQLLEDLVEAMRVHPEIKPQAEEPA